MDSFEYFIPVLKIQQNTPVFRIMNDNQSSLVASTSFIPNDTVIDIFHTGENEADFEGLGELHPMPYPLINDDIKKTIIEFIKDYVFLNGHNFMQFLDAELRIEDKTTKYNLLHVTKLISCVDLSNSVFETLSDGDIFAIDKLELDLDKLLPLPYYERAIFRLEELPTIHLFEKKIANLISYLNIENFTFIPARNWNSDIEFTVS